MSGITGVFMRTGEAADRTAVERAAQTTPHRAADRQWTFHAQSFCAVRQLTCTTPEDAHEREPSGERAGLAAIVFDGRLDNRDELADVLGVRLGEGTAVPDAALALAAWNAWQDDAPGRLLGDFAFVVWDARRERVFCARDVMGVRPFFYHLSARALVFGSELRQVLAHPLVPCAPDETTVAGVIQAEMSAPEGTLFQGVRRLPHAHTLSVCRESARARRYWRIDLSKELRCRDDDEYASGFREVFDRAVLARTRSAGPIGAYLSGGLDSSSVLATARLAVGPPITAFSLVFPGDPQADERIYIDAMARQCGVAAVQLEPPAVDVGQLLDDVRAGRDLPEPPNDMAGGAVRRAMAERRIRVALTGGGGDYALTGSYFHFAELLARGRFAAALRRGRDALRDPEVGWRDLELMHHAVWPLLPVTLRRVLRPLARRMDRRPYAAWIPRAFARRAGLLEPRSPREVPAAQLARVHALDAFESAWAHALDDRYQRGSAEWGIEERHPFFDRRVIEFALALPDEQRWKNGRMKYVLRRAMHGRLPELVRCRADSSKADFSELFIEALAAIGGGAFFDRLQIADAGWVEPRVLGSMYRRMVTARQNGQRSYRDLARHLWRVASVEFWYAANFGDRAFEGATWMRRRTAARPTDRSRSIAASPITRPC